MASRRAPGEVRDAIVAYLRDRPRGARNAEIVAGVSDLLGDVVSSSSVRSYLQLNEGTKFEHIARGRWRLVDRR
jgi:site-specific DNA-methyltransferase (adenine-specific)